MVRLATGRRLAAIILAFAFICAGCAAETPAEETAAVTEATVQTVQPPETTAATQPPAQDLLVETQYLSVQIPADYGKDMVYREVTENGIAMEIFSMVLGEEQRELFRIYFGDTQTGNSFGILNVDGTDLSVTVSVCEYSDSAFADQEDQERYYTLMDSLNVVLEAIRNDSRFRNEEKVVVETEEKQMSYWNFSLPEGMELEETQENGQYRITFFGNINGETHTLYRVAVGDETLRTVLGTYPMDGEQKPVSVESCDLPVTDGWEPATVTELYKMMDSINDVIQTIMESEGFREEVPSVQ